MRAVPPTITTTVRASRKTAEALRLEIERLAGRMGVPAGVRVRRVPDSGTARPTASRSGGRRLRSADRPR